MAQTRPTVDSIQLANYLVATVGPMPHLKLQKLVYYVEAWHLAILGESLIDDQFQAWAHGPVSRKIWQNFKTPDNPMMGEIKLDADIAKRVRITFPAKLTGQQRELLGDVIKEYGPKTAYHLECLTHAEKPWQDARAGYGPGEKCDKFLSKTTITSYYRSRIGAK